MARLATSLAATALTPFRRLKPRAITGGRFGGVAQTAADPLPQAGQIGGRGGELAAELLNLLLLSLELSLLLQDELLGPDWPLQPVSLGNASRCGDHLRQSAPKSEQESGRNQGLSSSDVGSELSRSQNGRQNLTMAY